MAGFAMARPNYGLAPWVFPHDGRLRLVELPSPQGQSLDRQSLIGVGAWSAAGIARDAIEQDSATLVTDRPPRTAALWVAILLYAGLGAWALPSLIHVLPDAAEVELSSLAFVAVWSILPLAVAAGLLMERRWAWWVGVLVPGILLAAIVVLIVTISIAAPQGALVQIGYQDTLSILGTAIAAACLVTSKVRRRFAWRRTGGVA